MNWSDWMAPSAAQVSTFFNWGLLSFIETRWRMKYFVLWKHCYLAHINSCQLNVYSHRSLFRTKAKFACRLALSSTRTERCENGQRNAFRFQRRLLSRYRADTNSNLRKWNCRLSFQIKDTQIKQFCNLIAGLLAANLGSAIAPKLIYGQLPGVSWSKNVDSTQHSNAHAALILD